MPNGALPRAAEREPSLPAIVLIFWAAFAVALVVTRIIHPGFFESQDPDSFLRIVQVRNLLAGQGWFDLVQHRMDPPAGALLQWSRLIDAPLALLVTIGNAIGLGEAFALTAWPTLLLLGMMAGAAAIGDALGGRPAAIIALVLVLFFIDPLFLFFPGDIDHHNAQVAVMVGTVAFVLRLSRGPIFGFLAGAGSALTLAIGLEMLPYVVVLGVAIALRFAWSGENPKAVAAYGATIGAMPAALYLLAGSPAAAWACDSLSWSLAIPGLIAGAGLAVLALVGAGWWRGVRVAALLAVGAAGAAFLLGATPECLSGPYGQLSPEVKGAFLDTVSEAQPIWAYGAREPVGAVGSLGPLLIALAVAWLHARRAVARWIVPTVLLLLAVALSFYQVRTLPFASALAIPVLAVWLAELRANAASRGTRFGRAIPVVIGFVLAIPFTWLLVGLGGEKAVAALSEGRIVPITRPKPDEALIEGLSTAERNCFDAESARLFAEVPTGLVLAPLFYGSTVLKLSDHSVVAGPYHRNGQAILDVINAMQRPPDGAKAIVDARRVDYIGLCSVSQEAAIVAHKAPDGLLAELLAGRAPSWLQAIPAREGTKLRLWRVAK